MNFFKNKKNLLLLLILFILLITIIAGFFYYKQKQNDSTKKISDEISNKTNAYKAYFNPYQVQDSINILNNIKLSSVQRYKALQNITFYFSVAYSNSHDPKVREYVLSLKDFAKKNFPKEYQEADFIINCADPVCGERLDDDLKLIRKKINESNIDPDYLKTINSNFDQASYITMSESSDKQYGFGLVLDQLEVLNNPKASESAKMLEIYLKKKYNFEYTKSAQ